MFYSTLAKVPDDASDDRRVAAACSGRDRDAGATPRLRELFGDRPLIRAMAVPDAPPVASRATAIDGAAIENDCDLFPRLIVAGLDHSTSA